MEEIFLAPGFRFHPTDEELITYYLLRKVSDTAFTSKAVAVVDLNKSEPWDLPGKASMGEKEWYFFNLKDRKYPTGLRTNRATESGYWKTTGKDREIFSAGVLIGMKKTLVFYMGRAPRGEKSNWVMHEYRLEKKNPIRSSKEEWVVCRVFQKSSAPRKPQQTSISSPVLSHQESPCNTTSMVMVNHEFGNVTELPYDSSSSSGFITNNISSSPPTNYINGGTSYSDTSNYMNWPAACAAEAIPSPIPSQLPWGPSAGLMLNNNPNQLNSVLLIKALQLRSCFQQQEAAATHDDHFAATNYNIPQGLISLSDHLGTDLVASNLMSASSSRVLPQEQPFNMDSIW